MLIGFPVKCSK